MRRKYFFFCACLVILAAYGLYLCVINAKKSESTQVFSFWLFGLLTIDSIIIQLNNLVIDKKKKTLGAVFYSVIMSITSFIVLGLLTDLNWNSTISLSVFCIGFANLCFVPLSQFVSIEDDGEIKYIIKLLIALLIASLPYTVLYVLSCFMGNILFQQVIVSLGLIGIAGLLLYEYKN